MLADSTPIFCTENFLINKFSDHNGLVWLKRKISHSILRIIIQNITYNTHGYISSSSLILYFVQYDEENLSKNEMF